MDRVKFLQNFSRRLNQIMSDEGYHSSRSKTGVDITRLSKISRCSYQMARKYTLGQALPELHVVLEIANWLKTSPSWLLFGENVRALSSHTSGAMIEITPDLLKYTLKKCHVLFELSQNLDEVINFIVEAIYDATHLHSDTPTIHKIIDMMISSATLIGSNKNAKKELKSK